MSKSHGVLDQEKPLVYAGKPIRKKTKKSLLRKTKIR